jgi:hypothetical protein
MEKNDVLRLGDRRTKEVTGRGTIPLPPFFFSDIHPN